MLEARWRILGGDETFIFPELWNAIIAVRTERAETTGCMFFWNVARKVLY